MEDSRGPLAGVRIIDITTVVLGPYGTQILADAGADVIKIETPQGDTTRDIGPSRIPGMAAYFLNLNRNKRSVVLDLKKPAPRDALFRLVETADVVVHNMRLAAADRLGLTYQHLSHRNPGIILACATGFRKGSRLQEYPAFDDIIQGMSGLASLNAGPDGEPRYVPSVVCDKISGHMLATAVAMALFYRERTGIGQEIHVPMMETILSFMLVEHLWGATLGEPELGLGYPRMLTPHRRPYATKDGYLCVIAATDAQWERLFAAIGRAALFKDPRFATTAARTENIDACYKILGEALRERTTAEWTEILNLADIPNGPAHTLPALLADEYLLDTNFFRPVEHPQGGPMLSTAPPVEFSETPARVRRLPPRLGEHNWEVLREAGLDDDEILQISP
ncbi:MAG: CoA transferase [Acetobacteraceae bacterium]|nr:CoA transferase [Acetobacteraceae bacterium]